MTDAASSTFVYVTFIKTTPQRVWDALTTPDFIRKFWFNMPQESDFKAGSPWKMTFEDGRVADAGQILESDPPRRLVINWRNEWKPELKAEGPAVCTYLIEEPENYPGAVKLTVTHTIARENSQFIEAVSGGWPRILSNLKSLLETGEAILKG